MSDAEIVIAIRADGSGARIIKRSLDEIADSGDKATGANARLEKQLKSTASAGDILKRAMGALAGVMSVRLVQQYADAWTDMNSRVRIAAGSMEQGTAVMGRLNEMARRTYTSLEQTAETYLLNATAMRELGYSTQETLDWVESINNALVVSGAKGQRAESVMNALSKAMALGTLSGVNLNTVISSGGRVAEALANSLGVSTNQLRKLGEQGKITTAEIVKISGELETLREEADSMPATISDAFILLNNALMSTIGTFDQATGVSQQFAAILIAIADNLGTVAKAVTILAGAITAALIPALLKATAAAAGLAASFLIGPGAIVAAIGAASAAAFIFRDNIARLIDPMARFGDVADVVLNRVKNNMLDLIDGATILTLTLKKLLPGELSAYDQARISQSRQSIGSRTNTPLFGGFMSDVADTAASRVMAEASKNQQQYGGSLETHIRGVAAASSQAEKAYAAYIKSLGGGDLNGKSGGGVAAAVEGMENAHKKLEDAIRASRTEEERLIDKIKELESLRSLDMQADKARQLEIAIERANGELEQLRIKAERNGPVAKAFESLVNQIDDGFRDAFRSAFTGADGGWKKMLEGWKASFKALLADLAYAAIARPIIAQVVGVAGGVMGVSSGAQASIMGDVMGSGGGWTGLLGNLVSIGSSFLNGGLYSQTLGSFGSGVGNLLTGNAWNAMGPSMGASIGAGAFGNLVYGAIGSLAASLFGLGGGMGGMIGGGIGSLAGGAVGTSMGSILGMAGGPVGAIVGGFLGSALGGLFGGKPKRETLGTSYNIGPDGMLGVRATSTKGADISQAKKFAETVTTSLNAVAQAMGATFAEAIPLIETNIGKKDTGTFWGGSRTRISSKAGDIDAIVRQVLGGDFLTGADQDLMNVARKSAGMGSGVEQIVSDLLFAREILEMTASPAELAAKAIEEINKQFDDMYTRAERLGLPMDRVTEALDKQRDAAIGAVKAMQAGFQSMEAMKATFDSWLYDQSLSGLSTLTPAQKLAAAQGNFGGLLSQVQGGDYSVTQQLLQAGQQLLQIGQGMYASSVDFALLENFVRSSITQIARDLDIPGYASGTSAARRGMAWVGERGPELVRFNGGETVYNAAESARMSARSEIRANEQAAEISQMRGDIQKMSHQIGRLVNKMMAGG